MDILDFAEQYLRLDYIFWTKDELSDERSKRCLRKRAGRAGSVKWLQARIYRWSDLASSAPPGQLLAEGRAEAGLIKNKNALSR